MEQITSIKEMQEIELNVLKKIHSFCLSNNIEYFLAYGTLIGAVRHNGFIPWDDDIDIVMLRENYDKFVELFPDYASEAGLFLANPYSKDHYYPHEYSKVCDASTVLVERMSKIDSKLGVYVDVFPLDNIPNNLIARRLFHIKTRLFRRLLNAANTNFATDDYVKHYSFTKRILLRVFHAVPIAWTFRQFEAMIIKYKNYNSYYVMQVEGASGAVYEKSWFIRSQLHRFENEYFCIPNDYDKCLRKIYGDYMKMPSKDKQIPHHVIDVWKKE